VRRTDRLEGYKVQVAGLGHDVPLWADFWPDDPFFSVGSAGMCDRCDAIVRVLLEPSDGEPCVAEIIQATLAVVSLAQCEGRTD
jgi:hypothetical protein